MPDLVLSAEITDNRQSIQGACTYSVPLLDVITRSSIIKSWSADERGCDNILLTERREQENRIYAHGMNQCKRNAQVCATENYSRVDQTHQETVTEDFQTAGVRSLDQVDGVDEGTDGTTGVFPV